MIVTPTRQRQPRHAGPARTPQSILLVVSLALVCALLTTLVPLTGTSAQTSSTVQVFGQPDVNGNGANGGDVSGWGINNPADLAIDSTGGIYVADSSNNRVLYFANDGDDRADFVYGQDGNLFDNDGNNNELGAESLARPSGVAVAPDDAGIYVADEENNRVLYFVNDGDAVADEVYGQPNFVSNSPGISAALMNTPIGVAVDATGLYVSDIDNNRVLFFERVDDTIDTNADRVYGQITPTNFDVGAQNNDGTDNVSSTPSAQNLNTPVGIVRGNGGLYVADLGNNRVLFYEDDGDDVEADAVYGQFNTFSVNTPDQNGLSNRSLDAPTRVEVDDSGNLYISDRDNSRVLFFENAGGEVDDTAERVYGQPNFEQESENQDFTTDADDSASPSAASLATPAGLLAANDGLYVADRSIDRITFYSGTSTIADDVLGQRTLLDAGPDRLIDTGSEATLARPSKVQVDSSGGVYISDTDNNRVLYYENDGDALADRVFGQPDFRTNDPNADNVSSESLNLPSGLLLDEANEQLYVADSSNNRVLVYRISEENGAADQVFGQAGSFTSSDAGSDADSLDGPRSVAQDAAGNLYVADSGNNRVLFYANDGDITTADKVFGQPDFTQNTANNGGIGAATLSSPMDVATGNGGVYIADTSNDRVLFYLDETVDSADESIPADQVYGHEELDNFTDEVGNTAQDGLSGPMDVLVRTTDVITGFYVADFENNRVLLFAQDNPLAQEVLGQPDFTTNTANVDGPLVNTERRPNATNLNAPTGLASGPDDRLFIVDQGNNRVLTGLAQQGAPTPLYLPIIRR